MDTIERNLAYFKEKHTEIDAILSDQEMPGITGDQLAKSAKECSPDTPIVLMTGYSKKIMTSDTSALGLDKVLFKPLTIEKLGKALKEVLQS